MSTKTLITMAIVSCAFLLVWTACSVEEHHRDGVSAGGGALRVGLLYDAGFHNEARSSRMTPADYDRVEFLVADEEGTVLTNMKRYYDMASSTIYIEGLQPGNYSLLVAGVRGEWEKDGVAFENIGHLSETWLRFPKEQSRALSGEYFYSSTRFSVHSESGAEGLVLQSDLPGTIEQKRIVGRLDVTLQFRNPYLKHALLSAQTVLHAPVFYTEISGSGQLSGEVQPEEMILQMGNSEQFLLLPSAEGVELCGTVNVRTRNYLGDHVERSYSVRTASVLANHVHAVQVEALHPEDGNGTMFITGSAYKEGQHARILQDDEHHTVYTDQKLRSFNTSRPMQVSVTDAGCLNVRFYSPKPVGGVLVRARIPAVGNEYIDFAYFDSLPAFADFHAEIPVVAEKGIYRTESGKIIELPSQSIDDLQQADFRIYSNDTYWKKLQKIEHGWNVRFDLYGGDPTQPDGGPKGNWMGIRPVHCREVVAFFLNFTYMIDMPEHEEILRANEDRLYGNGGINDKVTAETVLAQMRQPRTVRVGLVYTGNNVMGLGGGDVFGAYQGGWFEHYTSAYACEVMFHELGHVMGYSHDSSFTYGPWAQELMNHFYIDNLSKMPVESPHYLNSALNPNKY